MLCSVSLPKTVAFFVGNLESLKEKHGGSCSFAAKRCVSLLPVLFARFGDVLPNACTDYLQFALGCLVAIFWKRVALSVDNMFSLYFDYLYF